MLGRSLKLEGAVEREWKRERRGVGSGVRGSGDYRLSCPAQSRGEHNPKTGPRVWREWVAADPSFGVGIFAGTSCILVPVQGACRWGQGRQGWALRFRAPGLDLNSTKNWYRYRGETGCGETSCADDQSVGASDGTVRHPP